MSTKFWVICPRCHWTQAVCDNDIESDEEDYMCNTCEYFFDYRKAYKIEEILIKDVKKEDVLYIGYCSGNFWDGYTNMLASPMPNGALSIQTKWSVTGIYLPPVYFDNSVWQNMLYYLFDLAHFNQWKQEGYEGSCRDATDWDITLTLRNRKVACCGGIKEGYPQEWKMLNEFYESIMKQAGAECFDEGKRKKYLDI